MINSPEQNLSSAAREEWIEPRIQHLDIRDTAVNPARGLDHPYYQIDCTRS